MSISLENYRGDLRKRMESDRQITTAWILVPLLEILSAIIFLVVVVALVFQSVIAQLQTGTTTVVPELPDLTAPTATFVSIVTLLGFAFAYLVYKLIKRRNTHFARQLFVYEDLTSLARDIASKKDVNVSLSLNNLDRLVREARSDETEKNAMLWTILTLAISPTVFAGAASSVLFLVSFLPSLYVYYFLMHDVYNHERREDMFFDELNRTLMALGVAPSLPRRMSPTPNRSLALYVVLMIVTVGFFWVYWVYTLVNDPNNHFRQQAFIEDSIMTQVTPLMT